MEVVADRDVGAIEGVLCACPEYDDEAAMVAFARHARIADASLVARVDGVVVGVVLVERGPTATAEVALLAVHPQHRRRGIGRALVDAASTWAGFAGATALAIDRPVDAAIGGGRLDGGLEAFARCLGFVDVADAAGGGAARRTALAMPLRPA